MKSWWVCIIGLVILTILAAGCTSPQQPVKPVTTPEVTTIVPTTAPVVTTNATQVNKTPEMTAVPTAAVANQSANVTAKPTAAVSQPAFVGTWNLASLVTYGTPQAIVPGTKISVAFITGGNVSGNSGCNDYNALWTSNGTKMSIANISTTMKVCSYPTGINAQEVQYLSILGGVTKWSVSGDMLTLSDARGLNKATYKKVVPVVAASQPNLTGKWVLSSVKVGTNTTVPLTGTKVTAVFSSDGNLTGSGGCNTYTTAYKKEAGNITIGKTATTLKACEPEVMDQETGFLSQLQGVTVYTVKTGELTLSGPKGSYTLVFKPSS
jgi:heat shock protein HslJ